MRFVYKIDVDEGLTYDGTDIRYSGNFLMLYGEGEKKFETRVKVFPLKDVEEIRCIIVEEEE